MGEATVTHERMVMRIGHFLSQILGYDLDYQIMGSNAKIFIGEERKGYNADIVVVEGGVEQRAYKHNKRTSKGISNAHIIVEVLSNSTRNFDLTDKLEDYKQIPSLQQIIYFDQTSVSASTFIRKSTNEWLNIDYKSLTDTIPVKDGFIELEKVYSKIFEATEK
jgi:Uma2 family endonuclease